MDKISARKHSIGFSLIELMVVLAVLGLSLSLGSTLMQPLVYRTRLNAEANRLLGAINLARSEAVMRNTPVSICPSTMSKTGDAICAGEYAQGWIVFSNADRDRVVDEGEDEILRVYTALADNYSLTNRAGSRPVVNAIHYLPDGSSHSNRTMMLCAANTRLAQSLSIVINIVGRARLVKDWGDCPSKVV